MLKKDLIQIVFSDIIKIIILFAEGCQFFLKKSNENDW
jgi:hypothetical protein